MIRGFSRFHIALVGLLALVVGGCASSKRCPLAPENAVIIDTNQFFVPSSCATINEHSDFAWSNYVENNARYTVAEPNHRCVWPTSGMLPIDPQRYPILVFTYRAKNVAHKINFWDDIIFIEDERGGNGGLRPVSNSDLIDDGQVHEFRVDLRTVKPRDSESLGNRNLDSLWLALKSGLNVTPQNPAELEVIGLRMEAAPDAKPAKPFGNDELMRIEVTDQFNQPLEGGGWLSIRTESIFGVAELAGGMGLRQSRRCKTKSASTCFASRCRDIVHWSRKLAPAKEGFYHVILTPGVIYGGRVEDEEGNPVENAAVYVSAQGTSLLPHTDSENLTSVSVRSDADGRWRTPVLAADPNYREVRVVTTQFQRDITDADRKQPSLDELKKQTAILKVKRGATVELTVTDKNGNPLADAEIRVGDVPNNWFGPYWPGGWTDCAREADYHESSTRPGETHIYQKREASCSKLRRGSFDRLKNNEARCRRMNWRSLYHSKFTPTRLRSFIALSW